MSEPSTDDRLTTDDVNGIIEAIEHFVIGDNDDLDPIWRPYIVKLEALKKTLSAETA